MNRPRRDIELSKNVRSLVYVLLTYRESPPTRECDYRFGEPLRTRNGSASSLCATTVSKSLDRTSKNAQPNALSLSRTRYNRCTLDRRLGNINAELEQLTMDVGRTPKRVLKPHSPNKVTHLFIDLRPATERTDLPSPVGREAHSMPSHDSLGSDDGKASRM